MRLRQEGGENVNTFTSMMMAKIHWLEGANQLPHNLGQIMARALMDCSVESFRMKFTHVYNDFEINPKKYKYQEIINLATSSYRSCLDNKMWTPAEAKKADSLDIPVAMKAHMMSLIHSVMDKKMKGKSGGNGGSEKDSNNCQICGSGDHTAKDCPNKNGQNSSNGNKKKKSKGGNSKGVGWKGTPPKKGESHEKEVDGTTYYWCGKCTRWNTTHKSSEHIVGFKKAGNEESEGNDEAMLAQTGLVSGYLAMSNFLSKE